MKHTTKIIKLLLLASVWICFGLVSVVTFYIGLAFIVCCLSVASIETTLKALVLTVTGIVASGVLLDLAEFISRKLKF